MGNEYNLIQCNNCTQLTYLRIKDNTVVWYIFKPVFQHYDLSLYLFFKQRDEKIPSDQKHRKENQAQLNAHICIYTYRQIE